MSIRSDTAIPVPDGLRTVSASAAAYIRHFLFNEFPAPLRMRQSKQAAQQGGAAACRARKMRMPDTSLMGCIKTRSGGTGFQEHSGPANPRYRCIGIRC